MVTEQVTSMCRVIVSAAVLCFAAGACFADEEPQGDNRILLGGGNPLLSQGAEAIRFGEYDEGIRLTRLGLERAGTTEQQRAAGLSNLCAAHAAKREPDAAIEYCNQSLSLNPRNWRAYSNRSFAYWLKGMYSEATFDLDTAAALAPDAKQVKQIRGMLNEATLAPRVITEDHQ
jgi:tetratricopeptide (TPR) repeat protein